MKTIIPILVFLLLATNSFAQSDSTKNLSRAQIGFHIGSIKSELSGSEVDFETDNGTTGYVEDRSGISLGFVTRVWILDFLYGRAEVNYRQKGGRILSNSDFEIDKAHMNVLSLPIMLGLSVPRGEKFAIAVESGITLNADFNSDHDLNVGIAPGISNEIRLPMEFNIGVQAEYDLSKTTSIFANYRHYQDLDDFYDRNTGFTDYKLKNKGYSITFGLLFNLNER
jgi:hypothetical protein